MSEYSKPVWRRMLGGFFYVGFCLLFLGAGSALGWIGQSEVLGGLLGDKIKSGLGFKAADPFQGQDSITLLVLGCDQDWYFGGKQLIRHQARSDMMLVAKLDFKNKRITGLSIPRDTLVAVPGHREQKINGYHFLGGNDLSKEAVETLLPDIHIDRVVSLNFDSFKDMINTAGGVDVFVPKNMNYDDNRGHLHIHLKMGQQHLDGDQSEGFVRFRHSDDDFHRTARQRDFLLAFKSAVMKNWMSLPQVTNRAVDVLDHALTPSEVTALAEFAQKVGGDNIQMGMLPVVDANDGQFGLRVDERQVAGTLRRYHFVDDDGLADSRVSFRQ
jgi:LCP family protein required for cell wall assembly